MESSERVRLWSRFLEQLPTLRGQIRRNVSNAHEAADLLQEVCLCVWCHQSGPADPERTCSWFLGIVRYVLMDYCRKRKRQRHIVPMVLPTDSRCAASSAEDPERIATTRQELGRLLAHVSPHMHDIILRRYLLEESSSEIAVSEGTSATAVRMKLKRARGLVSTERPNSQRTIKKSKRSVTLACPDDTLRQPHCAGVRD